jgi:hypothetical protein
MTRRRRVPDAALDEAVVVVLAALGGAAVPALPCRYPGCGAEGAQHRNGVWCRKHERLMERVPS